MSEQGLLGRRVPFSAIVDRPALQLPDDARMLVWMIVNVERWSMERPMPRTVLSSPMGQRLQPSMTGAPHRIAMFGRLLFYVQSQQAAVIRTGAQINDWYQAQVPAPAPLQ